MVVEDETRSCRTFVESFDENITTVDLDLHTSIHFIAQEGKIARKTFENICVKLVSRGSSMPAILCWNVTKADGGQASVNVQKCFVVCLVGSKRNLWAAPIWQTTQRGPLLSTSDQTKSALLTVQEGFVVILVGLKRNYLRVASTWPNIQFVLLLSTCHRPELTNSKKVITPSRAHLLRRFCSYKSLDVRFYSLDMVSSHYHIFKHLQNFHDGTKFSSREACDNELVKFFY